MPTQGSKATRWSAEAGGSPQNDGLSWFSGTNCPAAQVPVGTPPRSCSTRSSFGVPRRASSTIKASDVSDRPNILSLSRSRPSCAGRPDTRINEAQGAEAPGQRTAASRLLRRVRRRSLTKHSCHTSLYVGYAAAELRYLRSRSSRNTTTAKLFSRNCIS